MVSKLDPYADQIMLWSINMTTRQMASKLKEIGGPAVSHNAVAEWLLKRRAKDLEKTQDRAEIIERVTVDLIEGQLGQQITEFRNRYFDAKQNNNVDDAQRWADRWLKAVSIAANAGGVQIAVVQQNADQGGELWSLIRRLKEQSKSSLQAQDTTSTKR